MEQKIICSRCIFDSKIPSITFNMNGVCNYCEQIDMLSVDYQTGSEEGLKRLKAIIDNIKVAGKGKKYDCVVGVSGGTDSSYLLMKTIEWGLRPLAVHYDNTWNSAISTENIKKITYAFNVDLYTYVVDHKEADDIFLSFMKAGVPEFDASTDIGFVQVLRSAAAKYNVKYILEGHSFTAEGISPQGNNYFDGKYIQDIHSKYGKVKMKTFPNMTFFGFLRWILVYRQKFIRPLWYLNYSKVEARQLLERKTNWKYYGGHHLENRATAFLHTIYNPRKFNIDNRNWGLSAEVRSGVLTRDEALKIYNTPIDVDVEIIEYVKKRLCLSDKEYEDLMNGKKRTWEDFNTYKKTFELFKPFFYLMLKFDFITKSFYLKYCG